MTKINRGEHMVRHPKGATGFAESDMHRYEKDARNKSEEKEDVTGDSMPVSEAFHEVFHNVPKTVKATGKTGKAKKNMMVAIALSKAGKSRK